MPKLNDVVTQSHELIEVPALSWLRETVRPGFVRGGVYLLTGEPGIGKTALAIQLLGHLASAGMKVVYVTTEQSLSDIKCAVQRIHGVNGSALPKPIRDNFHFDDSLDDIEALPAFLARRVLASDAEYHGVKVIVVDSIQGKGLASTATTKFRALYRFAEGARAQGLLTVLTGHVTKKGQIAGPKNLEHSVDCIIYLRRAFRLRPLFVPKNRFGPAMLDPLVLMMDDRGRLVQSPHSAARSISVLGYAGTGDRLAEGQASVSLTRYGARPELNAPFLPIKKVKQLVSVLSTLRDVDLADLSYEINCYVPGPQRYRHELDLAIAVALLASYLRQAVPERTLFVGELDLTRRVRAPEHTYLAALAQLIAGPQREHVDTVYVSTDAVADLRRARPDPNGPPMMEIVTIRAVGDLEGLLQELWPQLFAERILH